MFCIMNSQVREIEEEALSLPPIEREKLANQLFRSLHNQELNENDEAWLSLAKERWNRYKTNPAEGLDKNTFFAQIRDSLGWS